MKKFLQKTGMVIFSSIAVFLLLNVLYYKMSGKQRLVAFEVYDAIDISSQTTEYTELVLGDSVARQIFNPDYQEENEKVCYLATNQAIMPAGNYILLENFLENNPQVKTIYYVARPDSILGGINFVYTYSYFVTPMYREPFFKYLNQETREGVEKVFGSFFAKYEFTKWMLGKYPKLLELYNGRQENIYKIRNNVLSGNMPDMSVSYILRMQQICKEKNIEFVLLASPLAEGYDASLIDKMKEEMTAAGMEDLMRGYTDSICYISRDDFVDGIHMTKEYIGENRGKFIINILNDVNWKMNY